MKRLVVIAVFAAVAGAMAGCSPAVRGAVGITGDTDGGLVAVFDSCEKILEAGKIYEVDGDGGLGEFVVRWDELGGADESTSVRALPSLKSAQSYELMAWTRTGGSWLDPTENLRDLVFTVDDLQAVNPETVAWADSDDGGIRYGSLVEFHGDACA